MLLNDLIKMSILHTKTKLFCFLFPNTDLTQITWRYYKIYSVLLAIGMVSMATEAMYKYRENFFWIQFKSLFTIFSFTYTSRMYCLNLSILPSLKLQLQYTVILTWKVTLTQVNNVHFCLYSYIMTWLQLASLHIQTFVIGHKNILLSNTS